MITLYDFHAMNINERAEAIWNGSFIGERRKDDTFIQLYNLGSFYAEIFYNPEKNDIIKIRGFTNTLLIEPYLKDIEITF